MNIKIIEATFEAIPFIESAEKSISLNPWDALQIQEEFENTHSKIFLAQKNDHETVGFIIIKIILQEIEIIKVGVLESYRNQKIGSKLLEFALEYSANVSKEASLFLEVSCENSPAIGLYRKLNFKKLGLRKKYYHNGDDAIIMGLKLNRSKQ